MSSIPPEALLERYGPERRLAAEALRAIVKVAVPDALERVRPGWGLIGYDVPVGRRFAYFAFVWPEVEHVHLGFEYGVYMDDPQRLLQGAGRKVRWVTVVDPGDIDQPALLLLVREAARVAALKPAERVARMLDRTD